MKSSTLFIWGFLLVGCSVFAGQYHYKDILIGERAAGMGGAYVAISDDPSGVFHNPAGIVFGLENYLSVSANGYSISTQRFENIFPGQDYNYKSQSLLPVLFGFTQTFRKQKFGFAVVVPNSDLIDQSDKVTYSAPSGSTGFMFKRKFFRQDATYLVGPAYAAEVFENFAVGFSLLGQMRTIKMIDNTIVLYDPIGTGKYYTYLANLNRTDYGVVAKLGFQYMPLSKLSVGWTISKPMGVGGGGTGNQTAHKINSSTGLPVDLSGTFDHDMDAQEFDVASSTPTNLSTSFGAAYFFSRQFLITGQVDLHLAQHDYPDFPIAQTLNWAIGTEYYPSEGFALRAGVYTNNSKTEPIDSNQANQPPYINMMGASLGASLYRTGTSLSLTTSYVKGSGQGQAILNNKSVQTVSESNLAVYLSGSYQL